MPLPDLGFSVQQRKDDVRVAASYSAIAQAAGATGVETLVTLTESLGLGATANGTSFLLPAGTRFRLTAITVATRGNVTATAQATTFSVRVNPAGAISTASTPILFRARSATPATANAWDRFQIPVPDGFELTGDGTMQWGLTANGVYVTNAPTWDVQILGFRY